MEAIDDVRRLTSVREARGLTVEEVARQLRLAPRQILALEDGDWAALPGLAFVRGALRGYGRLLGVDVEPIVAQVAERLGASELRPTSTLGRPLPKRGMLGFDEGGSGNRFVWVLLVIVTVVAVALFFGGAAPMSSVRSWIGTEARPAAGAPAVSGQAPDPMPAPATTPATAPAAESGGTVVTPVIIPQPAPDAGSGQR
jgi:cytoskeleton protein RodZ